ncbi:MAG TPA: hypothetical protein VI894_02755, partial [Candidatus Nanoarchaeia archaeon]|nr:hypothetical protein [Candidatus Nanoarchaeia archaeon]
MENKKERKKAQVSLFLVLGLVIVAGSLFVYYIARESVKEVEKPSPPEIVPLKNYVEGCLSQIAVEGLRKLGEHGGYIQPNNPELSKKVFSMATAENNPAEADGISLGAEESFIPYWYYLKSKSNCKRCTLSEENIPSIVEIEQQLDGYIEEQLNSCLNSFKPFLEKKYEIKQTDRRIIRTTITEQEILIELGFPLEIKRGDQKFEITDFSTTIPYNFIKIYNEALTIIDFEEQTQALEFVSMRLVSAFSAPDAGKLPPIASIDENYYYTTWTLPSVELDLRDLLTVYINSVAINNSKTSPLKGDNEIEQKFYDSMHWNVFNETMNEKIEFLYLNWPIYLDITPRSGFLLRPSSIKHSYPSYLAPTQTNYYEFYYDISYPAVVAITDSNAPFGEYRFMFAIESNVRDNKNMLEWLSGNGTITWDPS